MTKHTKHKLNKVYRLDFIDNTFYIGRTADLEKRIYDHYSIALSKPKQKVSYKILEYPFIAKVLYEDDYESIKTLEKAEIQKYKDNPLCLNVRFKQNETTTNTNHTINLVERPTTSTSTKIKTPKSSRLEQARPIFDATKPSDKGYEKALDDYLLLVEKELKQISTTIRGASHPMNAKRKGTK